MGTSNSKEETDLHHPEMLSAVVSLKQSISRPAFHKNAAKGPKVDRM